MSARSKTNPYYARKEGLAWAFTPDRWTAWREAAASLPAGSAIDPATPAIILPADLQAVVDALAGKCNTCPNRIGWRDSRTVQCRLVAAECRCGSLLNGPPCPPWEAIGQKEGGASTAG